MSQGGEAACRPGVGVHRGGGGSPAEPSTATKTKRSKHFLSARFRRCPASFCHVAGSTHCLVSGLPKKKVQSSCQLQPPTLEELTTAPSVCLWHSAPPPPAADRPAALPRARPGQRRRARSCPSCPAWRSSPGSPRRSLRRSPPGRCRPRHPSRPPRPPRGGLPPEAVAWLVNSSGPDNLQ